ncbi:unnamed protein product [Durusdinium trenchii]|uniref:Uncharacterized protein n=1 Tax=Durusdinium trenchii TaxID=1381693 RepID=A0ABP0MAI9_9DINO
MAKNFLFVDSLGPQGGLEIHGPHSALMRSLVNHLWKTVPVFAVKTAGGNRVKFQNVGAGVDASALQSTMDFLTAQIPILWIDVRRRSWAAGGRKKEKERNFVQRTYQTKTVSITLEEIQVTCRGLAGL